MSCVFARLKSGLTALFLFFVFTAACFAQTQPISGGWQMPKSENPDQRLLNFSSTTSLLGKNTPFTVSFFCDPTVSKDSAGALGLEIVFNNAKLQPFNFTAFEGPDAPAASKKLLQVTVMQQGKPLLSVSSEVYGSTLEANQFAFMMSDLTRASKSTSKSILRKLSEDADMLQLTVTDYKNPKLKLEFSVPVAGKQAAFKTLLAGVK
jgi:hypothetical protein